MARPLTQAVLTSSVGDVRLTCSSERSVLKLYLFDLPTRLRCSLRGESRLSLRDSRPWDVALGPWPGHRRTSTHRCNTRFCQAPSQSREYAPDHEHSGSGPV